MHHFELNKTQLSNLEDSLRKEFACVSQNGSYAMSTIVGCNSRKYHGLFVCRQPKLSQDNFVLLSSIEETIIQRESEFHLGVKQYGGNVIEPKGHKYLEHFEYITHPVWTYHVGGVVFRKELLMHLSENRLILKYTLVDAHSDTYLAIKPFLAFRDAHALTYRNEDACTEMQYVPNGIKSRLYPAFSDLYMQFSCEPGFIAKPDWYRNVEYACEIDRGYPGHEDLFTPGNFLFELHVGQPVYLAVGLHEVESPERIEDMFVDACKELKPLDNLDHCLEAAARTFFVRQEKRLQVVAGYPWFGPWGRDTFISLPGLALCTGHEDEYVEVLRGMVKDQVGAMFPNVGYGEQSAYNSVDAPLWFVWDVQQYALHQGSTREIWDEFGPAVKQVIEEYAKGGDFGIGMTPEGLIHAGKPGYALTWMDAVVDGKPVTQRDGMPVEINALWYNAVMFALEAEQACGKEADMDFIRCWKPLMDKFPDVFKNCFWDKGKGYLADTVKDNIRDWSIRPNQILAVSLPYSPVSEKVGQLVLETVKGCLLTPRGLRTLAPSDPRYKGVYKGNQAERDRAYHQGTVWTWLLGHFVQACFKIYGDSMKGFVEKLYRGFEPALEEACIGSIAEIYDGDPPYSAKGAISQAWSVAELLRIRSFLRYGHKAEAKEGGRRR